MNGIRTYLLRLILCGFVISLAGALTPWQKGKRIVTLCGGCILLLMALRPLVNFDPAELSLRLGQLGLAPAPISPEEAKARNEALLEELVIRQTAEKVLAAAGEEASGLELEIRAGRDPETGLPAPVSIRLRGSVTAETRQRLTEYLASSLGIPPERQLWEMP